MKRCDLDYRLQTNSRPLLLKKLDEALLTSTSDDSARRKKRRSAATGAVTEVPVSETCIGAKENDQEVSDLIGAVDVLLDVVAVRSQMHMRQIGARPLLNANATIESLLWQRISWAPNVAACPHLAANEIVNETENVIANASVTGNVIMIVLLARVVMTTATMIANAETGRRNGRGCTGAGLIEVRTTSSLMEMNARQVLDAAVPTKKMITLAGIREILRYVHYCPSIRTPETNHPATAREKGEIP